QTGVVREPEPRRRLPESYARGGLENVAREASRAVLVHAGRRVLRGVFRNEPLLPLDARFARRAGIRHADRAARELRAHVERPARRGARELREDRAQHERGAGRAGDAVGRTLIEIADPDADDVAMIETHRPRIAKIARR